MGDGGGSGGNRGGDGSSGGNVTLGGVMVKVRTPWGWVLWHR